MFFPKLPDSIWKTRGASVWDFPEKKIIWLLLIKVAQKRQKNTIFDDFSKIFQFFLKIFKKISVFFWKIFEKISVFFLKNFRKFFQFFLKTFRIVFKLFFWKFSDIFPLEIFLNLYISKSFQISEFGKFFKYFSSETCWSKFLSLKNFSF